MVHWLTKVNCTCTFAPLATPSLPPSLSKRDAPVVCIHIVIYMCLCILSHTHKYINNIIPTHTSRRVNRCHMYVYWYTHRHIIPTHTARRVNRCLRQTQPVTCASGMRRISAQTSRRRKCSKMGLLAGPISGKFLLRLQARRIRRYTWSFPRNGLKDCTPRHTRFFCSHRTRKIYIQYIYIPCMTRKCDIQGFLVPIFCFSMCTPGVSRGIFYTWSFPRTLLHPFFFSICTSILTSENMPLEPQVPRWCEQMGCGVRWSSRHVGKLRVDF